MKFVHMQINTDLDDQIMQTRLSLIEHDIFDDLKRISHEDLKQRSEIYIDLKPIFVRKRRRRRR